LKSNKSKKKVKPKPTLEKTTPSAFFGSLKASSSSKEAEKRKAPCTAESSSKTKVAKKVIRLL